MHFFKKGNFSNCVVTVTQIVDWLNVLSCIGNISVIWLENCMHGLNFHHVYMKNNVNILESKVYI